MTVGQFKKFLSMFTLKDTEIHYLDSFGVLDELSVKKIIDDNDIVTSYHMFLLENIVNVYVKVS